MKIITMAKAEEMEGIVMPAGTSFYQGQKALEAKGWKSTPVPLKTPSGGKVHQGFALTKDDKMVLTGGISCGARHGGAHQYMVSIGAKVTCDKCLHYWPAE